MIGRRLHCFQWRRSFKCLCASQRYFCLMPDSFLLGDCSCSMLFCRNTTLESSRCREKPRILFSRASKVGMLSCLRMIGGKEAHFARVVVGFETRGALMRSKNSAVLRRSPIEAIWLGSWLRNFCRSSSSSLGVPRYSALAGLSKKDLKVEGVSAEVVGR